MSLNPLKVDTRERLLQVVEILKEAYPGATCSLDHKNPFELLVATILSAQCTDARVNMVTPALFKKYPDAKSMAKAKTADLEKLIASTGFYRNKTKSLLGASKALHEQYGGELPRTMDELVALPGVGRKTANVVLGNAFNSAGGVVVDTHVKRLSFRLGFSKQIQPEKVELDLNRLTPPELWVDLPHLLIQHGRAICIARRPKCGACPVNLLCPKKGVPKAIANEPLQLPKPELSHADL